MADINRGVWSAVEKAAGTKPYDTTLAAIERTLDWQQGSIEVILGGGDPTLLGPPELQFDTPEEHIALLHRWAERDPGLTDQQRQEFQTALRFAEERIAKRRRSVGRKQA